MAVKSLSEISDSFSAECAQGFGMDSFFVSSAEGCKAGL